MCTKPHGCKLQKWLRVIGILSLKTLLMLFKAAVAKEVDVISISLSLNEDYLFENAIEVGSSMAMKSNKLTVVAAGNDGPMHSTIVNTPPWILTVGASESEKKFTTSILLGNKVYEVIAYSKY